MGVYMEKLIISEPTMMALVAKDAHFTSSLTLTDLHLNPNNNPSKKVVTKIHSETSFCNACSDGTFCSVPNHVDLPMDNDNDHHHDCR